MKRLILLFLFLPCLAWANLYILDYQKEESSTTSLVYYNEFEETSGTTYDYETNTVSVGSATSSVDISGVYSSSGLSGNCIERESGDSFYTRLNEFPMSVFNDGEYSYQIAIKSSGTQTYSVYFLDEGNQDVRLRLTNSTTLIVYYDSGTYHIFTVTNVEDGNWHVFRIVYDYPNLNLYQGQTESELALVDTYTNATTTDTTGTTIFGVGANAVGGTQWLGLVDQIKFWENAEYP